MHPSGPATAAISSAVSSSHSSEGSGIGHATGMSIHRQKAGPVSKVRDGRESAHKWSWYAWDVNKTNFGSGGVSSQEAEEQGLFS